MTPEFPDGVYYYVLNANADGNPDFPGVPYCVQTYSSTVTISNSTTDSVSCTDDSVSGAAGAATATLALAAGAAFALLA